jgi:hypothetical protein
MATLDLLKEKLTNTVDMTNDIGVGAFKALNVIRDYEVDKIIDLETFKLQCKRIQDEHISVNIENLGDFDRNQERNEIINQIILEFERLKTSSSESDESSSI